MIMIWFFQFGIYIKEKSINKATPQSHNMLYTVWREADNHTAKRSLNDLVHRAADGFLIRHASLVTGLYEARMTIRQKWPDKRSHIFQYQEVRSKEWMVWYPAAAGEPLLETR